MDGGQRPSGVWRNRDELAAFGNASIVVDEEWSGEALILSIVAGVEMDRVPASRLRAALEAQSCFVDPERLCAGLAAQHVFVYGQRTRDEEWICVYRQRRTRSGSFPAGESGRDAEGRPSDR